MEPACSVFSPFVVCLTLPNGRGENPQQLRIVLSWGNACWQISLILIFSHAVRSRHNRLNGWWSHPHFPLLLVVCWMFVCITAGREFMKLMCCYQSCLLGPLYTSFFLLFSSQPSARAIHCSQMIAIAFSWGINNSRAAFISKGRAESMAGADSFILKLVSVQFMCKWLKRLTSDLRELKWKQIQVRGLALIMLMGNHLHYCQAFFIYLLSLQWQWTKAWVNHKFHYL